MKKNILVSLFICFLGTASAESSISKRIKLVILDNSGTTSDCGAYAPAVAFIRNFANYNIQITMAESREPMGLFKKDHIRAILSMPRINDQFMHTYKRPWNENDVENMFVDFIPVQLQCLEEHAFLIPGAADTISHIKQKYQVLVGSSTGFNQEMNELVLIKSQEQGYYPDVFTSASQVPKARPYWCMIEENMRQAGIIDPEEVLKVGSTRADMQEGKAMKAVAGSGTWTLGLSATGNYVGKTWEELVNTPGNQLQGEMQVAEVILYEAGADYVAPNINSLPMIIELINQRLEKGEKPRDIALDYLN